MILLTLNTHSLVERDYEKKLDVFVSEIFRLRPDVICLQEVNQSRTAKVASEEKLFSFTHTGEGISVKEDNHALRVVEKLCRLGAFYYWTWLPIKIGYGKYDEGMATLSLSPIEKTKSILLSGRDDYLDWRTRKSLVVLTKNGWFYNIHMGFWGDEKEPFLPQWERLLGSMPSDEKVTLMGDFNSPAEIRGEGYDKVLESGFFDTFSLAEKKDGGTTVGGEIDGWRGSRSPMRIDYIFCRESLTVKASETVFNGKTTPIVSDHYGVLVSLCREGQPPSLKGCGENAELCRLSK